MKSARKMSCTSRKSFHFQTILLSKNETAVTPISPMIIPQILIPALIRSISFYLSTTNGYLIKLFLLQTLLLWLLAQVPIGITEWAIKLNTLFKHLPDCHIGRHLRLRQHRFYHITLRDIRQGIIITPDASRSFSSSSSSGGGINFNSIWLSINDGKLSIGKWKPNRSRVVVAPRRSSSSATMLLSLFVTSN